MKANRAFRERPDEAGAETIGAIILFGIFVGVIAMMNLTAVPAAGLAAEESHYQKVLEALGGLQAEAEAAGLPGNVGATVGRAVPLGPEQDPGQDFMSFFLATPARATGQLDFTPHYGSLTLSHTRAAPPGPVYDIGNAAAGFPLGRITFNPHPIFRQEGIVQLENGGLVVTTGATESMRFAPPVTLSVAGATTHVTVKARALNGSAADVGGTAPLRVALETQAATLNAPLTNNADAAVLKVETAHGPAWGAFLNETSTTGGLAPGQFTTTVSMGTAPGGLDVVTWTVLGTGTGNDVRLTSGIAVYGVKVS